MDTETAELFFGLLTLAAGVGALAFAGLRIAAGAGHAGARRLGAQIGEAAIWLAFLVAATSTLGSLYFSEVADFAPCRLCWFQRIAMYPLSAVLLVGAIRKDAAVRWYAAPLAAIGAGISAYHTLIEWRPALDTGSCEATGPSCTYVWFREFGFLSLATMALIGFLTILTLLFVRFPSTLDAAPVDTETELS
ncbi:MAG: disulfide bond formation protein B [Ilumatobacteraceae bacterium]